MIHYVCNYNLAKSLNSYHRGNYLMISLANIGIYSFSYCFFYHHKWLIRRQNRLVLTYPLFHSSFSSCYSLNKKLLATLYLAYIWLILDLSSPLCTNNFYFCQTKNLNLLFLTLIISTFASQFITQQTQFHEIIYHFNVGFHSTFF